MKIGIFNQARRQCAATLAEVMVAVAVLAILLVSLFAGFSFGFGVVRATREDLRATQILTQKIEGIRLCTYYQLTNQCPSSFTETYATMGSSKGVTYYGTISQTNNANLPSAYQNTVRLITVTVTWTTSKGDGSTVTHTRSMQTQSAFYGLQNYLYGDFNRI